MSFSLGGLRAFAVVAEELHFGRAAKRLHVSQPALSMQIKRLEEDIGARLLDRDRQHVALTEAGAYFLESSTRLLADMARTEIDVRRLARGEEGTLTIGYTPTATYEVLPPLLRAYRKKQPAVRVELVELGSPRQPAELRAGRIDVGFACGPVGEPDLDERVIAKERFVCVLPRGHELASRRALKLADLDRQPFVVVNPMLEPAWAAACTSALTRAKVRIDVVQTTDTKIAMLGLVAAGVGLSLASQSMMRLARDGVVFREIRDLAPRVPLVALLPPKPSVRAVGLLSLVRA